MSIISAILEAEVGELRLKASQSKKVNNLKKSKTAEGVEATRKSLHV
jgi:hypothetical protein